MPAQLRELVKDPIAYRFESADGMRATMLMNGVIDDFTRDGPEVTRNTPLGRPLPIPARIEVARS